MATAASPAASAFPLLILVPVLALMVYPFFAPRLVRFEIVSGGLRISGDLFYGRTIAASDLNLDEARTSNLANVPEFKPRLRTNGVGMPFLSQRRILVQVADDFPPNA